MFVGKRPTRAKVMWWDRNGLCVLYKRLHRALFKVPETCVGSGPAVRIDAAALAPRLTLEALFVPTVDTKVELMEGDTPEEQAKALAQRLKDAMLI